VSAILVQRGVAADGLLHRQVCRQNRHAILAGGPHTDPPTRAGRGDPGRERLGGDLGDDLLGQVADPAHGQGLELRNGQALIDLRPLRHAQVAGGVGDGGNGVLVELPGGEQVAHVVEPGVQVPRRPHPLTGPGGRDPQGPPGPILPPLAR
jgi:hypothetical protein